MSELAQWTYTLCCTVVLCSLAAELTANSVIYKTFTLITALIILYCILHPIRIDLSSFSHEISDSSAQSEKISDQITDFFLQGSVSAGEEQLLLQTEEICRTYGLNPGEAQIYIYRNKDNGSGELVLVLSLPERLTDVGGQIKNDLEYSFGIAVSVEYFKEDA